VSRWESAGTVAYFAAGVPLFSHAKQDTPGARVATAQIVTLGLATPTELARSLKIGRATIYRHQERLEEAGVSGLVAQKSGPKGGHRLKEDRLAQAQALLDAGKSGREAARIVGVSETAIRNAMRRGRLHLRAPGPVGGPLGEAGSQPGERNAQAAAGAMGVGTHRLLERTLASVGKLEEATPEFTRSLSVAKGGTLVALPAVVELGLVDAAQQAYGKLKNGFYGLRSTVLCLAFMALLRIRTPERIQFEAPGELGILLGLDRAPEVKTIRRKLGELAQRGQASRFSAALAERWVKVQPREAGLLYVDGHVRPYHGEKHRLTKTYVARRRLSMPATTDYWINDKQAEPLFVVTGQANERLIAAMDKSILPEVRRLVGERRVTVVFDREGWSPQWFKDLYQRGFDVLTYRKGKYRLWPRSWFAALRGQVEGCKVEYELAERTVRVAAGLKMREVRRLRTDGKQTAVLTTRWKMPVLAVAWRMFERWRQENFFRYMREHFALDALADRRAEAADADRTVPNPERTQLAKQMRALRAELHALEQDYGARVMDNQESQRPTVRGFKIANGEVGKRIRALREQRDQLRERIRALPKRVAVREVPGEAIMQLDPEAKHLMDTIKMVAYRAETALVRLLGPGYARSEEEGRALVREILRSPADILPDQKAGVLRVRIHGLANPRSNAAVQHLCRQLNEARIRYPGTRLHLRYEAGFVS
jgi:transposase